MPFPLLHDAKLAEIIAAELNCRPRLLPPLHDGLTPQCLRIQMGMSGRSIFGAAGWTGGWGAAAEGC